MAAIFCDLDGSAFTFGTNEFLPGAREALTRFARDGNEIIFVTRREVEWIGSAGAAELLETTFPGCVILWGITSPRILINDEGALAINHPINGPWAYNLNKMANQF